MTQSQHEELAHIDGTHDTITLTMVHILELSEVKTNIVTLSRPTRLG